MLKIHDAYDNIIVWVAVDNLENDTLHELSEDSILHRLIRTSLSCLKLEVYIRSPIFEMDIWTNKITIFIHWLSTWNSPTQPQVSSNEAAKAEDSALSGLE